MKIISNETQAVLRYVKCWLERTLTARVPAHGLAVFRLLYALVLLGEVGQMIFFRHLLFDQLPYLVPAEFDPSILLWVWCGAIISLGLGWQRQLASVLNYVCSLLFLTTLKEFNYHFDHARHGINFLLLFLPCTEVWSVDAWLQARRERREQGFALQPALVPQISYFALMIVGIGLIYIDSIFWKFGQRNYMIGLGVWLPSSLPQFTWLPAAWLQPLLNQRWLMYGTNAATILLESVFMVAMWNRTARVWFLLPLGLVLRHGHRHCISDSRFRAGDGCIVCYACAAGVVGGRGELDCCKVHVLLPTCASNTHLNGGTERRCAPSWLCRPLDFSRELVRHFGMCLFHSITAHPRKSLLV